MDYVPLVLIVDDHPASREALASVLAEDRYDIRFATDGLSAMGAIASLRPDLVLLDQMMPGLTGMEVCQAMRQISELAEIPVVFVTALDDRQTRIQAFNAGADDVLIKPIDRLELRMRVRNITRLNRYRRLIESREDQNRLLTETRVAYDATIAGWAKALELRNAETKGHSERVTSWTIDLARKAGIEGRHLEDIRRGALLHDIGKMGIPDSILLKPGPLSEAERAVVETHPTLAREMLAPIAFLAPSIDIPYAHHERWDGRGYPRGLKGFEIPYQARLFSVVDVFDALTTDRVYRKAWSRADALEYLRDQAESQFDPEIVPMFCDLAVHLSV